MGALQGPRCGVLAVGGRSPPATVYVVPIKSDAEHFPPDGRLRVYRGRTRGDEWIRERRPAGLAQYRLLWRCRTAAPKGGGWRQGGSMGSAATPLGR